MAPFEATAVLRQKTAERRIIHGKPGELLAHTRLVHRKAESHYVDSSGNVLGSLFDPRRGNVQDGSQEVVSVHKDFLPWSGPELSEVGRTCVDEYLHSGAYVMWEAEGEKYVAMRRTLYTSSEEGYVLRKDNLLGDLDKEKGECLAQMALSSDEKVVTQSLLKLGAPAPLHQHMSKTIASFNRYSLVGIGPRSASVWRQSAVRQDQFAVSSYHYDQHHHHHHHRHGSCHHLQHYNNDSHRF